MTWATWRTAALGDCQDPGAGRRYRNRLARGGLVGVTATGSYAVRRGAPTYVRTYVRTYVHIYVRTYIHTYLLTYEHYVRT